MADEERVAFEGWTDDAVDEKIGGINFPTTEVIRRRNHRSAVGSVAVNGDEATDIYVETAGAIEFSSATGVPESGLIRVRVTLLRTSSGHDVRFPVDMEVVGARDPRTVDIPVGREQMFEFSRRVESSTNVVRWLTEPSEWRHAPYVVETPTVGALKWPLANESDTPFTLRRVKLSAASGDVAVSAQVIEADGTTTHDVWSSSPNPSVTAAVSDVVDVFDYFVVDIGETLVWTVESVDTAADMVIDLWVSDSTYVEAQNPGGGTSSAPVPTPVMAVYDPATGVLDGNGWLHLTGLSSSPLDGEQVGESSASGSNLMYAALSDWGSSAWDDTQCFVDDAAPAELDTLPWDDGPLRASFIRGDATIPFCPITGGPAPDLVKPWDVTTDPKGKNDPAFDSDGTHTFHVRARSGATIVVSAGSTVTVVTSRGAVSAPPVPTGLAVTVGDNQLSCDWADMAGATSYEIGLTPTGQALQIIAAATSDKVLTGLQAVAHDVKVRSVDSSTGLRSAWSSSLSRTPTDGGGPVYGETHATGDTSGAFVNRATTQGPALLTQTIAMPGPVRSLNVYRGNTVAQNAQALKNAPSNAWARYTAGKLPAAATWGGPYVQVMVTLGWGVNANYKNDWHIKSLQNLAATADGAQRAAWEEIVDSWIADRSGGLDDWASRIGLRLGLELGQWFPDFPGIDPGLVGALGNVTGYSQGTNAAMNLVNADGNRFHVWKLAWDEVVGSIRARCQAAGVLPPLFIVNMVHADADPGEATGSGPAPQWVEEVATDVTQTPDLIGLDIYGRAAAIRPTYLGGTQGDPDNYDWTDALEVLERHRDLCVAVNRPATFPEWWSCRKRNPSGGGSGWNDHERAAFTRFMADWMDTGLGGAGVPVHSHNMFHQPDQMPGDDKYATQTAPANNYLYSFITDKLPDGTATSPAPLMRAAMAELFPPNVVNLG